MQAGTVPFLTILLFLTSCTYHPMVGRPLDPGDPGAGSGIRGVVLKDGRTLRFDPPYAGGTVRVEEGVIHTQVGGVPREFALDEVREVLVRSEEKKVNVPVTILAVTAVVILGLALFTDPISSDFSLGPLSEVPPGD